MPPPPLSPTQDRLADRSSPLPLASSAAHPTQSPREAHRWREPKPRVSCGLGGAEPARCFRRLLQLQAASAAPRLLPQGSRKPWTAPGAALQMGREEALPGVGGFLELPQPGFLLACPILASLTSTKALGWGRGGKLAWRGTCLLPILGHWKDTWARPTAQAARCACWPPPSSRVACPPPTSLPFPHEHTRQRNRPCARGASWHPVKLAARHAARAASQPLTLARPPWPLPLSSQCGSSMRSVGEHGCVAGNPCREGRGWDPGGGATELKTAQGTASRSTGHTPVRLCHPRGVPTPILSPGWALRSGAQAGGSEATSHVLLSCLHLCWSTQSTVPHTCPPQPDTDGGRCISPSQGARCPAG